MICVIEKRLGFLNETGQKVEPDHTTLINYGFKKGAQLCLKFTGFISTISQCFFLILRALFWFEIPRVNINNHSCIILCY